VTVAAINPIIGHVMFVAEGHRLRAGDIDVGEVRRLGDGPPKVAESGQDEDRAINAHARDGIGAAMKDLGH